ncbi:MAG: precorrin-3B synthase [Thiohalospira sp.]
MYKRRARLAFAGDGAERAVAIAAAAIDEWAEARVAPLADAEQLAEAMAWADLLVSLDDEAKVHCAVPPAGTRHVHWPVAETDDIEARIRGLAGGMRLLARSDGGRIPGAD